MYLRCLIAALGLALFTGSLAWGQEVADQQQQRSAKARSYASQIEEVLAGPDFGESETRTAWRLKDRDDKETRRELFPEWLISIFEFFERNQQRTKVIAQVLEVLIWAIFIGLMAWLIWRYRTQLQTVVQSFTKRSVERALPTTMFGLDVTKSNLPSDIVGTARTLWGDGQHRKSVALLLRASLIELLHHHGCHFYDSDTESECCARIDQAAPPPVSQYMRKLVLVWQQLAYAHRNPSSADFDVLCQQWQEVF